MSALSSRAPSRFAAWVAMVAGLVSAGNGHPARWLISAHAADEKTVELVETRHPAKAGPASESLSTVSLLRLLSEGHDDPQHYTTCLAYLKRMDAPAQQGLGLTVVHKKNDLRSHGGRDRKLEWIGPHPADGMSAHASPGDYLNGLSLGAGVALSDGGATCVDGRRKRATPAEDAPAKKKHATAGKTSLFDGGKKKPSDNGATHSSTTPAHVLRDTQAWQRSVLEPVQAFVEGPHGSRRPNKPTVELGRNNTGLVEARMSAVVGCMAAICGAPRQPSTPDEERVAAATLVAVAKAWGVSPSALAQANTPGQSTVACTAPAFTAHFMRSQGWTMTTLQAHIKAVDALLNPVPPGRVRRPRNTPRSIPVAPIAFPPEAPRQRRRGTVTSQA